MLLCDGCHKRITKRELDENDLYYPYEWTLCRKCDDKAEKLVADFVKKQQKVKLKF